MKQPFIALYDECFDDVYRYSYSRLGNKWDTDDVVSDIFRKSFEYYGSLKEHSNGKAWLMTIARNTIVDFYRRKKDTLGGEAIKWLVQPDISAAQLEAEEDLDCLKKALDYLPDEDREYIRLKYFAGLKYREIGELAEKSEEAVKTRVFRLLKKIGVLVRNCMDGVMPNG